MLTSNFLISRKIEDFEEAKVDQFFLDKKCQFYAPELLKNGSLTKASDIYSLGQLIKALRFDKSDNDLLSPFKFSF
jgi:serine/threonine protein kinase